MHAMNRPSGNHGTVPELGIVTLMTDG